jgi:xanthine dehydrogenase YagR molybdenum-binding subunit
MVNGAMDTSSIFGKAIGKPLDRIEGREKVIGSARYAADYYFKDLAYGVVVTTTISKGTIVEIDSKAAEAVHGVLSVMTHLNAPEVPGYKLNPMSAIPIFAGKEFKPFLDNKVHYNLQPVALVIAQTLEAAQYAATLVKVKYNVLAHETDIEKNLAAAITPEKPSDYSRGQVDTWQQATIQVQNTYHTPIQVHNPMEPHATTAYWLNDQELHIHNKTQSVKTTRQQFAKYFNLKEENVKVHSPYVGGAFGSASRMWPQEMAAVMGAKQVRRPVQVALERSQVFNMVGYRPRSIQKYAVGADTNGSIIAIRHDAYGSTSQYEQFTERILEPTKSMYSSPGVQTSYKLVPLDMSTPCPARGPGETSGSFAMESAIDELAYMLKMDPLAFRLKNFSTTDPLKSLPWSSNYLKECYEVGAGKFGWNKRNPIPGSMRIGNMLVGWGMAAGIYKAERREAAASIRIFADGHALIQCSVADTGPGSATIMTQIAADALGVPVSKVEIEWANADFPEAPPQYGSHTTASTGSAVHDAALALKNKFNVLAKASNGDLSMDYTAILKQNNLMQLEATASAKPGVEKEQYSGKSFCANFVEVQVNSLTFETKVTRVVSAVDAGKIMNEKTARSQVYGSVVWGIGLALMEEGIIDHRYGRYVNNNLADYHVPVNGDVPEIDVQFINREDANLDPMGAKGLGEIALVGFTAAVSNAVYHATGKRIRNLPITLDKLI